MKNMLEAGGSTKTEQLPMSEATSPPVDEKEQQWLIDLAPLPPPPPPPTTLPSSSPSSTTVGNDGHLENTAACNGQHRIDAISTTVAFCSYNSDSHTVMSNRNNTNVAKTVRSTKTYNVSSRMTSTRQTSRQLVLSTTKDIRSMNLEDLTEQLENEDSRQNLDQQIAPCAEDQFFEQMLNLEKERFSDLFPQLRCVRVKTMPAETSVRIVRKADGTITRIQTTSSRSVIRCNRTTKDDGSKKNKVTTAFVEYRGPEGRLSVKLDDEDASGGGACSTVESESDEDDDEPMDASFFSRLLGKAYRKRSSVAAAAAGQSPPNLHPEQSALADAADQVAKKKRLSKAYYAAEELVLTEQRYVDKLDLINLVFRNKVVEANQSGRLMPANKMAVLFSNLNSVHAFHKQHFLPELQKRLSHWQEVGKISDVVCQQAPFLKLYSDYINNYKRSVKTFEETCRRSNKFASIVNEIERMPQCENLPLASHIIAPVQRVMRYHLLMQEYLKNLDDDHPDKKDTEKALELVKSAANHANEIMRKMDQYRDLVELQEQLGSQVPDLVNPSRELVKQGRLLKLSSKSEESQSRQLFLFNDMLLICSERLMALTKYKVKASLRLLEMSVLEGDRLDVDNSFYVRSKTRAIQLCAKSFREKTEWMETLWQMMARNERPSADSATTIANRTEQLVKGSSRNCSSCLAVFGVFRRDYSCQGCQSMICKKCCRDKLPPTGSSEKPNRLCQVCFAKSKKLSVDIDSTITVEDDMRVVPASDVMLQGWMQFRANKKSWTRAYFRLNKDFVMCRYDNGKDKIAKACLALPGVRVSRSESTDAKTSCCTEFVVVHKNRSYAFRCSNKEETARWMALVDLASRAQIPQHTQAVAAVAATQRNQHPICSDCTSTPKTTTATMLQA